VFGVMLLGDKYGFLMNLFFIGIDKYVLFSSYIIEGL